MTKKLTFLDGIKHGLPVCFAYITVSFTFGLIAVQSGLPAWLATILSFTNLTSAGQFAGINMIALVAGYFEIGLAVFIINSRYMLMSLSISQQLDSSTGTLKRLLMSFFITDEIFALASMQKKDLNFKYFIGLGLTPLIGWTLGTALGACVNDILPERLQNAMGIALYCMFIAIILPPAKKSWPIVMCIAISITISCILFFFVPSISFGFRVIIASVIAAVITAVVFPEKEEVKESEQETETNEQTATEVKNDL